MANYHVTQKKDQKDWNVKREKAERSAAIVDTQKEAEKLAKKLVEKSGGGEAVIHKPKAGPIRDKDTVRPAHDPNPPKDKKH